MLFGKSNVMHIFLYSDNELCCSKCFADLLEPCWRCSATFFTYLVSHSSSSRENKRHLFFSCYITSKKPFTSAQNSVLSEYKVQTTRLWPQLLQPGSYLCCIFPWTLKFQHHREGAGVAATFQKVSSLKPFVRFYPLWNVFWAVPSKGISATQVTLSQCHHISQGKQNNPNREAKEASLIIWLPSKSFPLLTHPKVRAFMRPLFLSRSCILSFTSPPPVRRFVFRSQDVINVPPMWLLTWLALDFSLLRCERSRPHHQV